MSQCQVVACRVSGEITHQVLNDTDKYMSSVYITSLYMVSVRVMVEHNQAELKQAGGMNSKQCLTPERLARLPGRLG